MRPTGALHLGHYHGVLKNWLDLQKDHQCFFFVADWHALTTHYQETANIYENSLEMVRDWLAVGIDPEQAVIFRQSEVLQHAELHVLLSMITPLSWLERMPTYKDQQQKLKDKDLSTYGFLGYPLLQSADILLYQPQGVPVGEDQVVHVEITREIARRFNRLYGEIQETDLSALWARFAGDRAKQWQKWRKRYQESGDVESLEKAEQSLHFLDISEQDKALLKNYLYGYGKPLLTEPQPLLTSAAKMLGLDGQKMSKSYHNTIALREASQDIDKKISTMPTDPARKRRQDAGNPEYCPVWSWHQIYSSDATKDWVKQGCTTAAIGCLDCKKPLVDAVEAEVALFRQRAAQWSDAAIKTILAAGQKKAAQAAADCMGVVKKAMGLL
jgi:tryptophanyl-tRNA synthetase